MMSYRLRRNRLLAPQLARLSRPHRGPRAFQPDQVLAPLPRLAPASQINFSSSPLDITAGLPVTRPKSSSTIQPIAATFPEPHLWPGNSRARYTPEILGRGVLRDSQTMLSGVFVPPRKEGYTFCR